jgi:hypothetical protein
MACVGISLESILGIIQQQQHQQYCHLAPLIKLTLIYFCFVFRSAKKLYTNNKFMKIQITQKICSTGRLMNQN